MNTKIILSAFAAVALLGVGCNKFLDTMPDNRMDLDDLDKIKALNVSAYSNVHSMGMLEHRTDNVVDNGPSFGSPDRGVIEAYYWEPNSSVRFDSSNWMWERNYSAIATANQSLEALKELPDMPQKKAVEAEALLCRAWAHFKLVNYFGQAYSSDKISETDLGVPYVTVPETKIGVVHPRKSVAEVYRLIEQDLEAALPHIDDAIYVAGAAKYHFNYRAAHAFAAQFYLYYEKWDKAKEHATLALGANPASDLRDIDKYTVFNTGTETTTAFINTAEPANLMLQNNNSRYGRFYKERRYAHSRDISQQTFNAEGPWGSSWSYHRLSRNYTAYPEVIIFYNKYEEFFQITDKVNRNGIPYVVAMPFTVDKTLLVRAEAEVMLGQYEAAVGDLNMYYTSKKGNTATLEQIVAVYHVPDNIDQLPESQRLKYQAMLEGLCKPLHPRFALAQGTQYDLMQAVLHARRCETLFSGDRWDDLKRYGIEVKHPILATGEVMILKSQDPRKAMQLPANIIQAGLPENPGY